MYLRLKNVDMQWEEENWIAALLKNGTESQEEYTEQPVWWYYQKIPGQIVQEHIIV